MENDKFQGLSIFFSVDTKGRLSFISGEKKAHNNIMFFFGFCGFFRHYFDDFCSPLYELINKPSIIFNSTRTIIFGKTIDSIEKYMPYIKVDAVDFFKIPDGGGKSYGISVVYNADVRKDDEQEQQIFFANVIADGQ